MRKLDNIEIKNFKSIRNATIDDCRRVNLFIGYPNVGKSNILEALGLMTFIPEKRVPLKLKGLVRYEKFTQFFNYFNIENPVSIKFNEKYTLSLHYDDESFIRLTLDDLETEKAGYHPGMFGMKVGRETIISSSSDAHEATGILKDDFSGRFKELQELKVKPYKFSGDKIYDESYSARELKVPYGRNLFEVIANSAEIQKEFSELLKPYGLELVIDVSTNEIKITPPIKNGVIQTIPISLMADTLIRLIFFKTAIISNKNSVLVFEEPEAHMFPPFISKLTNDILFDKNNNQYFIATHSPYVLNEFMDNLTGDELAIYIVTYLKEKGETQIMRMNDEEMHEAYQFGYDFFMNLENFTFQPNDD